MGEVKVQLTLKNVGDITRAKDGHIKQERIRQITVDAVVDTGASNLIITEALRDKLGLEVIDHGNATLGNNGKVLYQITEPIEVRWQNRFTVRHPVVLPGSEEVLLGVIPLEDMDLIVDPVRQTLSGAHGDQVAYMVR